MSGDDLIVVAPWLAFAAGLAVIGWRLAASRGRRRLVPPGDGQGDGGRPGPDEAGDRPPEGRSVAQDDGRRNR